MSERCEASAPARLCIAGESLDYWRLGPSIVAAISLKTHVTVAELPTIGDHFVIYIESSSPLPKKSIRTWRDICWYEDPYLRYAESAVDTGIDQTSVPCSISVRIESSIPVRAGVSSSAAVILATAGAVAKFFGFPHSTGDICKVAYDIEHNKLNTGAGWMDFLACARGGLQSLDCSTTPPSGTKAQFPKTMGIVLVDTLKPHSTKSFISDKRERIKKGDEDMIYYADTEVRIVERIRDLLAAFADNGEEIGALMTRSHELLRTKVRCSTPLLDACVEAAIQHGALGAKLTGSGDGGCMFALVDQNHREAVALALSRLPVKVYDDIQVVEEGLTINGGDLDGQQIFPEV